MVSYHNYKLISEGICSHCNKPDLEWENQQGWRCKRCGYIFLIDKVRKAIVEPDCQGGK